MEKLYILALRDVRLTVRRRLVLAAGIVFPMVGALLVVVSGGAWRGAPLFLAPSIVLSASAAGLALLLPATSGDAIRTAIRVATSAPIRLAAWSLALVPLVIVQGVLYLAVLRLAGHAGMPGMLKVAVGLAALAVGAGVRLAIDRD